MNKDFWAFIDKRKENGNIVGKDNGKQDNNKTSVPGRQTHV